LQSIAEAVSEMKSPLQAEWKACQQNPEEFAEMERQFQEVSQRLKNLQDNNGDWLRKLNFGVQDIKVEISNNFALGMREISRKADKYLDDKNLLKNPTEIANRIEIDINLLMSELEKQISKKAAIVHSTIEEFTGLNLNSLEYISMAKGIGTFKEEDIKRSKGWEKYWTAFRGVAYSGGTVSGIGALVAQVAGKQAINIILGGPIGVVATFAILGITVAQGLSQIEQMTKREVTPIITRFIQESQELCKQSLNSTLTELERFMGTELTSQIRDQKQNCDRTLKSIQETRKLSKEQTERKIKELTPPLQELAKVEKAIEQVTQSMEVPGSQEPVKNTGEWVDG
jgi:hypothetical protein